MKRYIDDHFNLIATDLNTRASSILDQARIDRTTTQGFAAMLESMDMTGGLSIDNVSGLVEFGPLEIAFRMIKRSIEELYDNNNQISLLMSNSRMHMESDLRALEENIQDIERSIASHRFMMGKSNGYSFVYSDSFIDELGRDDIIELEDRSVSKFGPSHIASVDRDEGSLVLPSTAVSAANYGLSHKIVSTNIVYNESVGRAFPLHFSGGTRQWRYTVDADAPIQSSILEAEGHVGAQASVDYKLDANVPASEIIISPFADIPMQLVQVYVFDGDSNAKPLLDSPMTVDTRRTINFPLQITSKIRLILNQPSYSRSSIMNKEEDEYKAAFDTLRNKLVSLRDATTYNTGDTLFSTLLFMREMTERTDSPLVALSSRFDGAANRRAFIRDINRIVRHTAGAPIDGSESWGLERYSDGDMDLVKLFQVLAAKGFDMYKDLSLREISKFEDILEQKGIHDPEGVMSPLEMIYKDGWSYRYSLGIQNVSVGIRSNEYRGVFVSKPMDSNGDIGEVTLRAEDWNYRDPSLGLDNSMLTSTEYSVSKVSNPVREADWIPIMPHGVTIVESERLYPNESDRAMFRFPASFSATISFYRNGRAIAVTSENLINDIYTQSVIGVNLASQNLNRDDIITVTYTTAGDYSVINFEERGFDSSPITNVSDRHGSGQTFSGTTGDRSVTLARQPHVNDQMMAESGFDPNFGVVGYNPVIVRMNDGTIALNMTNYKEGGSGSMSEDGIRFFHSGDKLIFNKVINQGFTVYYQYSQSTVRFRAVMRCNHKDVVSPKIRSVQLRGKTRRPATGGLFS